MSDIRRGQPISAKQVSDIANNAVVGRNMTTSGDISIVHGRAGVSIMTKNRVPLKPGTCRALFTDEGTTLKRGSIVFYKDALRNDDPERPLTKCCLPTHTALGNLAVAEEGAVYGDLPIIRYEGITTCLRLRWSTVPTMMRTIAGFRIGCKAGDHVGEYDRLGPFRFLRKLNACVDEGEEVYFVEALVERNRGDYKLVKTKYGLFDGAYRTIVWNPAVFELDPIRSSFGIPFIRKIGSSSGSGTSGSAASSGSTGP